MAKWALFGIALLLFAALPLSVASQSAFDNIEKIKEYNKSFAQDTLRNVSLLIAFLGGILSFLAPCTVALFPAFLAITAKNDRNPTLTTLVFFLGFSLAFVSLGLLLTSLGQVSFAAFQNDLSVLVQGAGIALVFLGLLMFFGKGFSFIRFKSKLPKNFAGTFIFGALFAVGWSACIGPIIAGIFTMAAVLHNYVYAAFLLFFYSLGLALPLFIASFAQDKFNFSASSFMKGFSVVFKVGEFEIALTSSGMVAGLLMVFLGLFFIFNKGTTAITSADLLGMIALLGLIFAGLVIVHKIVISRLLSNPSARKIAVLAEALAGIALFAFITSRFEIRTSGIAEQLSNAVLEDPARFNVISGIVLAVFIAILVYFVWHHLKKEKKEARK